MRPAESQHPPRHAAPQPRVVRLRLRRRARHVRRVLGRAGLAGLAAASLVSVPALSLNRAERPITPEAVALAAPAGAPWPGAGQGTGMFLPVAEAGVRADPPGTASGDSTLPGVPGSQAAAVPPGLAGASRGIPSLVLDAYRRAAGSLSATDPGCGLPWWLLAGIGRIESGQAAGGRVTSAGTTRGVILGPRLDGTVPGTAVIRDTDGGALDLDPVYDRAVGPMQFLPGTWRSFAADGNGDGRSDPSNIYDAALAAGRYLCASGGDLRTPSGLATAVLSYNYSTSYLSAVLGWGLAYRDGVWSGPVSSASVPPPPVSARSATTSPAPGPDRVPSATTPAPKTPRTTAPTTTAPATKAPTSTPPTSAPTSSSSSGTSTSAPTSSTTSSSGTSSTSAPAPTGSTSTSSTTSTSAPAPTGSTSTSSTTSTSAPAPTGSTSTSSTTSTSAPAPTGSTSTSSTTSSSAPQPTTTSSPATSPPATSSPPSTGATSADPTTGSGSSTSTCASSGPATTDGQGAPSGTRTAPGPLASPSPTPDPSCPSTPTHGPLQLPVRSASTEALAVLP